MYNTTYIDFLLLYDTQFIIYTLLKFKYYKQNVSFLSVFAISPNNSSTFSCMFLWIDNIIASPFNPTQQLKLE